MPPHARILLSDQMPNEGSFHPKEISQRNTGVFVWNVFKTSQQTGKGKYRRQILRRKARIISKNIFDTIAAGESSQHLRNQNTSTPHNGLAVADGRIDFYSIV